jgi:hypothetical protein
VDHYDQRAELVELHEGDRLFVPCSGGPVQSRLERYPPRLEIEADGGVYVLVDDGPRDHWHYLYLPDAR